jgi:ribonuclease J
MTEQELTEKAKVLIKDNKYVFVICSSTNIDRLSAFFQATPRGKYFICDHYQKDILTSVEKFGKQYSSIYSYDKALYYNPVLDPKLKDRGFCMMIRNSPHFKEILSKFDSSQSLIIYSMWQGYIQDSTTGMAKFLDGHEYVPLHTSGHASKDTIKTLCDKINPKIGVLPIHSDNPDELVQLGIKSRIISLKDGEELII